MTIPVLQRSLSLTALPVLSAAKPAPALERAASLEVTIRTPLARLLADLPAAIAALRPCPVPLAPPLPLVCAPRVPVPPPLPLEPLFRVPKAAEPVAQPDPSFLCLICYEEVPETQRTRLPCCGQPDLCTGCVRETVESAVRRNVGLPTCPNGECARQLTAGNVAALVDPAVLAEVQRVELEHQTNRWCSNKQCSAPVPLEHRGRRFVCNDCSHVTCLRCRDGYHRGPCVGGLKHVFSDLSVNLWHFFTIQDAKKCPHCHTHVIKNGGCRHFTHRREAGGCGGECCWICMQDYRNHNGVLCVLRAIPYGSPKWFGPTPVLRLATKTAAVGLIIGGGAAAAGACAAGAVTAAVTAPVWYPLRKLVKKRRERRRAQRRADLIRRYRSPSGEVYRTKALERSYSLESIELEPIEMLPMDVELEIAARQLSEFRPEEMRTLSEA